MSLLSWQQEIIPMKHLYTLSVFLFASSVCFAQFKTPLSPATSTTSSTVDLSPLTSTLHQQHQKLHHTESDLERSEVFSSERLTQHVPSTFNRFEGLLTAGNSTTDPYAINITSGISSTSARSLSASVVLQELAHESNLPLSNPSQELALVAEQVDKFGIRHINAEQVFQGVPVFGASIRIHQPTSGKLTVTGRLEPSPKGIETIPSLDEASAEIAIENLVGTRANYASGSPAKLAHPDDSPTRLVLLNEDGVYKLAYEKTVHPDLAHRYRVLIDAHTGEELIKFDEICRLVHHHPTEEYSVEDNPPSTGQGTDLNGVTRNFGTFSNGGTFWMVDGSKPMFDANSNVPQNMDGTIVTANAQGTYPDNSFNAIYSEDQSNNWNNRREVSAHYNSEVAYEYFRSNFGRNSIDGNGGTVIAFIDVSDENGADMDNAFWNGRAMFYGNGNRDFTDLAGSLDVGGHEMSHGVVQNTANLVYQDEPGALNEHFADVFGVMIDRDDWRLGEDIVTSSFPSGALRDCANPRQGGSQLGDPGYQPGHYNERYTGSQDNGGVHINSGIVNNVCYRIGEAIGRDKTEQLYYNVLVNYLSANSRFIDYRNALQQAATQMYGSNSSELQAVVAALDAQGIPGSSAGGGGTSEPNTQQTNPGTQLVAFADADEQLVRVSDLSAAVVISDITPSQFPASKPSLSDDGRFAVLVTRDGDINFITIDYTSNTVSEQLLDGDLNGDDEGDIRNATLSRDGTKLALITTANDPFIYVIDLVNNTNSSFELYTPGSNGERVLTVDYADAMEWDYAGEYLIFDALNTLTGTNGLEVSNWDIGVIEVYRNGVGFANGEVRKLFSTLEPGASVGNPTLSKNSEQVMAYDYFLDNTYETRSVNLITGNQGLLWRGDRLGWPTYTADDEFLIFNAANNGEAVLAAVELTDDKLSNADATGNGILFAQDGYRAWAYANGSRSIISGIGDLINGAEWTVAPNPTTDKVAILRKASTIASDDSFRLYDSSGRLIATYSHEVTQLDLSDLGSGTYILQQGATTKQIIVR